MKYKEIKSINDLSRHGTVDTQHNGLAILTTENGRQYYYFNSEGELELIPELNSVGLKKTYMHTPTRNEGYAFTVDSHNDIKKGEITRTRYVVFVNNKEVRKVFQNKRPNPEPDGLLLHTYYREDGTLTAKLVAPSTDPDIEYDRRPDRRTVGNYLVTQIYNSDRHRPKPIYMICKSKDGTQPIEILSTHELRQLYESTKDSKLKKFVQSMLNEFLDCTMQDTSMKDVTPLQHLHDISESVDMNTIPGIIICSRFPIPGSSKKFKSYYLIGKNNELICLGKDNIEKAYSQTEMEGNYHKLFSTDDNNIFRLSGKEKESYRGPSSYDDINGTVLSYSDKLIFLDTREILEIGIDLPQITDTGRHFFYNGLADFCLVDNKRNTHYNNNSRTTQAEEKLYCEVRYGNYATLHVVFKGKEPVYALYHPQNGKDKEFFDGETLKTFVLQQGVDKINRPSKGYSQQQTIASENYLDRISSLFNPTFIQGEYVPKSPEEIERIEKEVQIADLRRKLQQQNKEIGQTAEQLRKLGEDIRR